MFQHERYTRQCFGVGTWEGGKNPGLVVEDLCGKAQAFLQCIGRGDPRERTGRDFEYDPGLSSPLTVGSPMDPDSQGSIDIGNIVDGPRQLPLSERFEGDDWFDDDDFADIVGGLAGPNRPPTPGTVTAPSGHSGSSHDSVLQRVGGARVSTKMRAATLGYLWQFADQPAKLRNEFRRLRSDGSLHVLHLCGCGLCFITPGGLRVYGCVERSHLRLGSSDENTMHTSYHRVIQAMPPDLYAGICEHVHQGTYGEGIF